MLWCLFRLFFRLLANIKEDLKVSLKALGVLDGASAKVRKEGFDSSEWFVLVASRFGGLFALFLFSSWCNCGDWCGSLAAQVKVVDEEDNDNSQ